MLGGLLGLGGQSSGGLLGGLLGGGQQQTQPQQQSAGLLGSLLGGSSNSNASLASGLFSSLLGGGGSTEPNAGGNVIQLAEQQAQEPQSNGLLSSFLNLFH